MTFEEVQARLASLMQEAEAYLTRRKPPNPLLLHRGIEAGTEILRFLTALDDQWMPISVNFPEQLTQRILDFAACVNESAAHGESGQNATGAGIVMALLGVLNDMGYPSQIVWWADCHGCTNIQMITMNGKCYGLPDCAVE